MSANPVPSETIYPFAHEVELRPGMIVMAHRDHIERYEGQPRKYFDPEKLLETGLSMTTRGQEQNMQGIVLIGGPDYRIGLIDGERRLQASFLPEVDIEWLRVEIKRVIDDDDRFESSAVSNFCREPHTPMENALMVKRMCERLVNGKPRPRKSIALMLGKSVGWVDMHLSLNHLHPDVQALLEPTASEKKRLTMSHALLLTTLEHSAQVVLARHIGSMKLFAARHAVSEFLEQVDAKVKSPTNTRGPKDNYDLIANFARDMEERSNILLKTGSATLLRMFEARKPFENEQLIDLFDRAIGNMSELAEALRNAKDRAEKNIAARKAQEAKPVQ